MAKHEPSKPDEINSSGHDEHPPGQSHQRSKPELLCNWFFRFRQNPVLADPTAFTGAFFLQVPYFKENSFYCLP